MSLKDGLLHAWKRNLDYGLRLVDDLSAKQMVAQPEEGMNHPAWVFSHLGEYYGPLVALIEGKPFADPKEAAFGMKSNPIADVGEYASKADLVSAYKSGHEQVISALEKAPANFEAFGQTLERWLKSMPTTGVCLPFLMITHESTHLGQLSAWRRALGLPSV